MEQEQIVNLKSQKILLDAINTSLMQKNLDLQKKVYWIVAKERCVWHLHNKKSILLALIAVAPVLIIAQHHAEIPVAHESQYISKYLVENLRGDAVTTSHHWKVMESVPFVINVVNADLVTNDKMDSIKNSILSEATVQIDDSLLHKGPKGSSSTYYEGWKGAIIAASSEKTKFHIPQDFVIISSPAGEGRVTIILSEEVDMDGNSGFTRSVVENDQILKSIITIYDVDSLSAEQLGTLVRHEFGHALGLGHSSAPEDLMAPTISTFYPYVSECVVDALSALYGGRASSEVVCEK